MYKYDIETYQTPIVQLAIILLYIYIIVRLIDQYWFTTVYTRFIHDLLLLLTWFTFAIAFTYMGLCDTEITVMRFLICIIWHSTINVASIVFVSMGIVRIIGDLIFIRLMHNEYSKEYGVDYEN